LQPEQNDNNEGDALVLNSSNSGYRVSCAVPMQLKAKWEK